MDLERSKRSGEGLESLPKQRTSEPASSLAKGRTNQSSGPELHFGRIRLSPTVVERSFLNLSAPEHRLLLYYGHKALGALMVAYVLISYISNLVWKITFIAMTPPGRLV